MTSSARMSSASLPMSVISRIGVFVVCSLCSREEATEATVNMVWLGWLNQAPNADKRLYTNQMYIAAIRGLIKSSLRQLKSVTMTLSVDDIKCNHMQILDSIAVPLFSNIQITVRRASLSSKSKLNSQLWWYTCPSHIWLPLMHQTLRRQNSSNYDKTSKSQKVNSDMSGCSSI